MTVWIRGPKYFNPRFCFDFAHFRTSSLSIKWGCLLKRGSQWNYRTARFRVMATPPGYPGLFSCILKWFWHRKNALVQASYYRETPESYEKQLKSQSQQPYIFQSVWYKKGQFQEVNIKSVFLMTWLQPIIVIKWPPYYIRELRTNLSFRRSKCKYVR